MADITARNSSMSFMSAPYPRSQPHATSDSTSTRGFGCGCSTRTAGGVSSLAGMVRGGCAPRICVGPDLRSSFSNSRSKCLVLIEHARSGAAVGVVLAGYVPTYDAAIPDFRYQTEPPMLLQVSVLLRGNARL